MQDEEVALDMVDFVRKRDLMTFSLYPDYEGFKRKYIPGEVKGKEYPADTVVNVVNYHDQYILRIFPSILPISKGRRKSIVNLKELKKIIDLDELRKLYPGKWGRICVDPIMQPS